MIAKFPGGTSVLPPWWTDKVSATAREAITQFAPVQYMQDFASGGDAMTVEGLPLRYATHQDVSENGDTLAVVMQGYTPSLLVYKKVSGAYVQFPVVNDLPGKPWRVSVSRDGGVIAVANSGTPALWVYALNGGQYTRVVTTSITGSTTSIPSVSITGDGAYIAHTVTTTATIVKRNGAEYTRVKTLTAPGGTDSQQGHCSFSADGRFFAQYAAGATYKYAIYGRSGDDFTMIADGRNIEGVSYTKEGAFSADGMYIAFQAQSTTGKSVLVLRYENGTYVEHGPLSPASTGSNWAHGNGIGLSTDGEYLVAQQGASAGTGHIAIYERHEDGYVKIQDPFALGANDYSLASFCRYGDFVMARKLNGTAATVFPFTREPYYENLKAGSFMDFGTRVKGIGIASTTVAKDKPLAAHLFEPVNKVWRGEG